MHRAGLAIEAVRAELNFYPDLAGIKIMGPEDVLGGDYSLWQYGSGNSTEAKNLLFVQAVGAAPGAAAAESFFCIHDYDVDSAEANDPVPITDWNWWVNGWGNSPAPGIPSNLLLMGHRVYAVHPRSSQSYRARKRPSGVKADRADCLALAEALRFEGQSWTPVAPPDPLVQRLRLLWRDEVALIEQRTALVNQLIQTLYEYYPAALDAFDDWTSPAAWAFVEKFPTPEALVKAGKRKWQNFLHTRRLYHPQTYEKRLDAFSHAQEFCGSEAVTAAKSALALALVKLLHECSRQNWDCHRSQ